MSTTQRALQIPQRSIFEELLTMFDEEIEKRAIERKVKKDATLLLWNQAVAVLREDNYQITQSTRNYATALSQVGLGSPDELEDVHPYCNCYQCEREKAEKEYKQLDSYRNYRGELRGGGY